MGRDERYYLPHYVVSSAGLFQKYLVLHTVDKQRFQAFLRDWVYDGHTLIELAKPGSGGDSG